MVDRIIQSTNHYIENKSESNFRITEKDLWLFFGALYYLGIMKGKNATTAEMWNPEEGIPYLSTCNFFLFHSFLALSQDKNYKHSQKNNSCVWQYFGDLQNSLPVASVLKLKLSSIFDFQCQKSAMIRWSTIRLFPPAVSSKTLKYTSVGALSEIETSTVQMNSSITDTLYEHAKHGSIANYKHFGLGTTFSILRLAMETQNIIQGYLHWTTLKTSLNKVLCRRHSL